MIDDGRLTAGHARALITAPDPMEIAKQIVSLGLSVRQTEGFVRSQSNTRPPKAGGQIPVSHKDPNVAALEQELSLLLGLRVALQTEAPRRETHDLRAAASCEGEREDDGPVAQTRRLRGNHGEQLLD